MTSQVFPFMLNESHMHGSGISQRLSCYHPQQTSFLPFLNIDILCPKCDTHCTSAPCQLWQSNSLTMLWALGGAILLGIQAAKIESTKHMQQRALNSVYC